MARPARQSESLNPLDPRIPQLPQTTRHWRTSRQCRPGFPKAAAGPFLDMRNPKHDIDFCGAVPLRAWVVYSAPRGKAALRPRRRLPPKRRTPTKRSHWLMSDERRKYYRYPVAVGSEAIVVRHHGVERPARLVNLSSDGFRVDMQEQEIVEVGDVVLMATSNGFHRVRVVNVARENGTLQLGLQRLQDLPANAVETQAEREGRPSGKAKAKESLFSTLARLAAPLGLAAMIVGGIAWAWTTESDPVARVVQDGYVTPR